MLATINRFRRMHGVEDVKCIDGTEKHNCLLHCFHISRINECVHTPWNLMGKWDQEIIGVIDFSDWWKDRLVFDVWGNSPEHRSTLLESKTITFSYLTDNWRIWAVVRGCGKTLER